MSTAKPSWQLRVYNVFARVFQKPALAFVQPQWLARKVFNLNAALTYARPRGVVMTPATVGGVAGAWVETQGAPTNGVLYFVHGGAFVLGSLPAYRTLVARIAQAAGRRAFVVDYRLAPEHPFPAGFVDVTAAYRGLLKEHAPEDIALCGDSAGGNMILALLHEIGASDLPMPAKAGLMSPVSDLRGINPSLTENRRRDPLIPLRWAMRGVEAYLAGQSPDVPRLSPVLGDFAGCCPVMFQVGESEVLRDDSLVMADRLRAQGVQVDLRLWPHVPHVWHLMSGRVPEADAGIAELGAFLKG